MPKNPGGKKYKKLKHNMEISRPLELPDSEQEFALVNKLMGNGRATVTFIKNQKETIDALGIISGKLRKRKQWVIAGNIVLISIREFEKDKVDIIHVYKEYEMNELKRKGHLPDILVKHSNAHGGPLNSKDDDDEFAEFVDYDEKSLHNKPLLPKKTRGDNVTIQNFDYLDATDDEEEKETNGEEDIEEEEETDANAEEEETNANSKQTIEDLEDDEVEEEVMKRTNKN